MCVGGLWKQVSERELLAYFCPLFELGFKYRRGPVGWGRRRKGGKKKHGIAYFYNQISVSKQKKNFDCLSLPRFYHFPITQPLGLALICTVFYFSSFFLEA